MPPYRALVTRSGEDRGKPYFLKNASRLQPGTGKGPQRHCQPKQLRNNPRGCFNAPRSHPPSPRPIPRHPRPSVTHHHPGTHQSVFPAQERHPVPRYGAGTQGRGADTPSTPPIPPPSPPKAGTHHTVVPAKAATHKTRHPRLRSGISATYHTFVPAFTGKTMRGLVKHLCILVKVAVCWMI